MAKQKLTMADYETWKPEQKQAWLNYGSFLLRLYREGKIGGNREGDKGRPSHA